MAYQVIARTWRPKTFQDLIGQNHISQTLVNALKSERLPHALLFTGPRGTGKTSSARILAKTLRCQKALEFMPCGECSDCLEINEGHSVDVVEIDGASNNGVDAIRELRETVGYMPSSGKKKIYIIDEVHMLTTSAFNALLKTLEEPPPHVIFIMATTEAHKIPNTILSRCQRFDFRRIPLRLVADHLKVICQSEDAQAAPEALWMIARQGDGSMRDSESLLDQVITFSQKQITVEKVSEILGLTQRHLLIKTLNAIIRNETKEILPLLKQIFSSGADPQLYCKDLLEEVRHLLLIKIHTEQKVTAHSLAIREIVDLADEEAEQLKALSSQLSEESIHLLFDMLLKGERDLTTSQDPQLVLEMLLLRMTSAPRVESLLELLKNHGPAALPIDSSQMTPTQKQPLMAPKQPAMAKPSTAIHSPPTQKTPLQSQTSNRLPVVPPETSRGKAENSPQVISTTSAQNWADLVLRVNKVNNLMGTQLEHCFLKASDEKKITLGIPLKMKFLYDQASQTNFQKKLHNYIRTFWGKELAIEIVVSDKDSEENLTPKAMKEQQQYKAKDDLMKKVEADPLVHSMKQIFKSEIKGLTKI